MYYFEGDERIIKKSFIIGLAIGSIVITSMLGYLCYEKTKNIETSKTLTIAEESLKTKTYGVLNVPMEKNNMIWCGTFQLAWNELRDNIIKEDIKFTTEENLSSELNKKAFIKDYINDKDYIAMVGYNKDGIVEKINKSLKDKFNEGGKWKVEAQLENPEDILAYSFLKKNIEFKYAFEEIKDGLDFNGAKVKAFGICDTKDEEIRCKLDKQVKILYYENDDNYIVSFKGKIENDEIILAKIPSKDTLNSTLNYALSNSNKEIELSDSDILKVPMFEFNIKKKFKELENKPLANKGFTDYSIVSAIQRIDFSLTEKGAQLKSKAEIVMSKGANIIKVTLPQ